MLVETPRLVSTPGGVRAVARVVCEGPLRAPARLWFETEAAFAHDFEAAPEAFLLALMPVAARWGEPRLAIEAPACPRLVDGLDAAMRVLAAWYPRTCRVVPIEARGGLVARVPRTPSRAASLLSGGVDSLSLLAHHRALFPPDHPRAIRDGVLLRGWHGDDVDGEALRPARDASSRATHARLAGFAARLGLGLVPVATNVRAFHPTFESSQYVGFGAGMNAVGHLFARRWTDLWIGSHGLGVGAPPEGSHALLDPCFSSSAVEVHFGEPAALRAEKMARVAAWDEALAVLQTCFQHEPLPADVVNCGRCEKCLRTMLMLAGLGRLDAATTFPGATLTPALAATWRPSSDLHLAFAADMVAALDARGRGDLARAVRRAAARARRRLRRRRWRARWRAWGRAMRPGGTSGATPRLDG